MKYSKEFKKQVVEEYLNGLGGYRKLAQKYEINKTQVAVWVNQWRNFKDFPDSRGKSNHGRLKKLKQDDLTDKEYIKQLEMEIDVLKYMAFLKNKK